MRTKLIPSGRKPTTAAAIAVFVVVIAAVLVSISLAGAATAEKWTGGEESSLQGEIVALDSLHSLSMVTLRSDELGGFPGDRLNIFVNSDTRVMTCNMTESANDLGVSREATVIYHEVRGWLPVADSIDEHC